MYSGLDENEALIPAQKSDVTNENTQPFIVRGDVAYATAFSSAYSAVVKSALTTNSISHPNAELPKGSKLPALRHAISSNSALVEDASKRLSEHSLQSPLVGTVPRESNATKDVQSYREKNRSVTGSAPAPNSRKSPLDSTTKNISPSVHKVEEFIEKDRQIKQRYITRVNEIILLIYRYLCFSLPSLFSFFLYF